MEVYLEEQKFNQPLVIIGLSIAFIVVGISSYNDLEAISQSSLSTKIGSLSGLIIILFVGLLFLKLKLKTRVDEKGICYQFFPIHVSNKLITWDSISNCYIRKYNAIFEYGGWRIRFNFSKKTGKAYTTKGTIGLQLELKNGKKLLIGTKKRT
jgi:hypothetical protein